MCSHVFKSLHMSSLWKKGQCATLLLERYLKRKQVFLDRGLLGQARSMPNAGMIAFEGISNALDFNDFCIRRKHT